MLLKSSNGALFVQTGGPNTQPYYLGCVDVDDISEPGGDIDTLIQCFNPDGTGWQALSSTTKKPEPVTTKVTSFVDGVQSYLERARPGQTTLFIHQRDSGNPGTFGNYIRSWVLAGTQFGTKTGSDLVKKEDDNASMMAFDVSALPPVHRAFKRTVARKTTSEVNGITSIAFCGSGIDLGKTGFAACKPTSSATPDVLYTNDYGVTWTATAADPLAVDEAVRGLACFPIGRNTTRVIAGLGTTRAGGPAVINYSDDLGATWTSVTVGSTNAQFLQSAAALFAYDAYNIWVVAGAGFVYKSTDGGITWTTQDAGVTMTANAWAVHFATDRVGAMVGASGAVSVTQDGGATWTAKTVPASTILDTVYVLDSNNIWVGGQNGNLYYTTDGGTTWSTRAFAGSGAGQLRSIKFLKGSSLFGTVAINSASPVGTVLTTIDGGFTWEAQTTPTNAGLNDVFVIDENTFWAVGEASGSLGVILKGAPAA